MNRVPLLVHEQNAVFGRANRMTARFARTVALSFEPTAEVPVRPGLRRLLTGNPTRPEFASQAAAPAASDRFRVLVLGGSQGARVFSDVVPAALALLPAELRARLDLAQQCRPEDLDRVRAAYAALGCEVELASFFADVPARMAAVDLLVSRSGASTVAEVLALGRPSLLVPYLHAADDHQTANAKALAEAGAAILVPQPELTAERLAAELEGLMRQPAQARGHGAAGARAGPSRRGRAAARRGPGPGRGAPPMTMVPHTVGPIHFVGIGGIGMSGIAEILSNLGYTVQGSDIGDSANVQRLRRQGVTVAIGHAAKNLGKARVVVVSTAIQPDNPELLAARAKRLPVVRRADMLAELMRLKRSIAVAGTHGKTTTTAMMAALLDAAELDPTVVNGGIINAYGTNARLGQGEWIVVEADESDGSFLRLPATVAVVTNIDPEHMEHYGSFDALRDAFHAFVERVPFYGFAALCIDHPEVQALFGRDHRPAPGHLRLQPAGRRPGPAAARPRRTARCSTWSCGPGTARASGGSSACICRCPGRHNVQNALAVIAVARELGITDEVVRRTLSGLEGVKRRFTRTGTVDGVGIVDDYGHHPVEIKAVLTTARARTKGRVIAVVQPHRYTRLASLFDEFCTCFHDADTVLVAPVYAAGEPPIEGATRDALVDGVRRRGHRDVRAIDGPDDLAPLIADFARPGDLVVCLGAGSITQWANALPGRLAALEKGAGEA